MRTWHVSSAHLWWVGGCSLLLQVLRLIHVRLAHEGVCGKDVWSDMNSRWVDRCLCVVREKKESARANAARYSATRMADEWSEAGDGQGKMDQDIAPFTLTDAEWRARLTPARYSVLRRSGTEPAGTGDLYFEKRSGEYYCAGCSNHIFQCVHGASVMAASATDVALVPLRSTRAGPGGRLSSMSPIPPPCGYEPGLHRVFSALPIPRLLLCRATRAIDA